VRAARWGAAALVVVLTACSGRDDASTSTSSSTSEEAPAPTFTGDGSPFCDSMLALGQLPSAEGATPEGVLEATKQLAAHLDEAQASTPSDAPPDLDALIDDYRMATNAILAAGGDVRVAFADLQREHPEVVARLRSPSSHQAAYDFLVERCRMNAP
jgi:hypothetical protein